MKARHPLALTPLLLFCAFEADSAGARPHQPTGFGEKSISCPADREYRDVRPAAGRDEYCELVLPGFLIVQDGPSRWWYSEGHLGEEGLYLLGRKVGGWKECNRFGRCRDETHESLHVEEKAHALKPELPVTFTDGKYVFDFGSCWSTLVTRKAPQSIVELNISRGRIRCQITHVPELVGDGAGAGPYHCEIPFEVGVRSFDSIDLRQELPRSGLPQFCRPDDPPATTSQPNGIPAMGFAVWSSERVVDAETSKEFKAWTVVANAVDVECAAIASRPSAPDLLTVRLNQYAERLVIKYLQTGETKADACGGQRPLTPAPPSRDESGRVLFNFALDANRARADRQRQCIAALRPLTPSCASR